MPAIAATARSARRPAPRANTSRPGSGDRTLRPVSRSAAIGRSLCRASAPGGGAVARSVRWRAMALPTDPKPPEKGAAERSNGWAQWTGAGFEFGGAVLLFFLLGSWLDATWGTQPWMRVAGSLVGVVVGTYLLIRPALGSGWTSRSQPADGATREASGRP